MKNINICPKLKSFFNETSRKFYEASRNLKKVKLFFEQTNGHKKSVAVSSPCELQPCNIFILFLVRYGCNIVKNGKRWIEIFTFAIGSKNGLLKNRLLMRRMLWSIFLVVAIFSFAQPSSAQGAVIKSAARGVSAVRGVTKATNVSKLTGINPATITGGVRYYQQPSVSGKSVSRLSPTLSQNLLYDHKSLLQPLPTVKLKAKNHGVNKGMKKVVNKGVPAKTNKGVAGGKRSNSDGPDIPDMPSDSLHNSSGQPQSGRLLNERRFLFFTCLRCGGSGKEKVWNAQTKTHSEKQCEACKGVGRVGVR